MNPRTALGVAVVAFLVGTVFYVFVIVPILHRRPAPATSDIVEPVPYGSHIHLFKMPTDSTDQYLRSLEAFLDTQPQTLVCSEISTRSRYSWAIICFDTALPAQDITEEP